MRTAYLLGAVALMAAACSTIEGLDSRGWRRNRSLEAPSSAGSEGDPCAPGNSPRFEDHPDAMCALKTDQHVPDLIDGVRPPSTEPSRDLETRNLQPLAGPNTTATSCNGKTGPGFTTCGPDGDDSCCRTAAVPAGTANALVKVDTGFDLDVYEVTAARLRVFIDAFNGDIRGAAQSGKLAGFNALYTERLPSSRAEADTELGPSCQFRGDPREFGARTWWSQDVEAAVAAIMTDDNERAADLRADATKPRLDAKPANCVSQPLAAAFCAWDDGRLPTNVEWVYAAVGGPDLREYPWGPNRTDERLVTDLSRSQQIAGANIESAFTWPSDFPFFSNGMNAYHISPPGRKSAGVAKWGHHDMAGNVLEWMADTQGEAGIVRGGSWEGHSDANSTSYTGYPIMRTYGSVGFRCAHGAANVAPQPQPQPPGVQTVPVYHAFNQATGDHLLTLTTGEGAPGYVTTAVPFELVAGAPTDDATQAPLYRCRRTANGVHYASNLADCEGNGVNEGVLGTVSRGQVAGTQPLYRCFGNNAHISTLAPNECTVAGMKVEGGQGFAYPRKK